MDLSADLSQIAPHVKHAAKHAAPHIKQGFTMVTLLVTGLVTALLGTAAGWYVRGRGLSGMKTDASNVVTTVEHVQAAVHDHPAA